MKTKKVWFVFAGCMLMYGSLMGVLFNSTGVLITGIMEAEGWSSGDLAGYYTMRTLVQCVSMLFTAQLMKRFNIKLVTACVGIISSLAFFLMYFYTRPEMWYLSGILSGAATSLSMLLPTTVIKAWFVKKRGTFTGIFTTLSGVIGALLNPVVSRFIENRGWRNTALMLSALNFAMMLMAAILMERRPADVGAVPYGGKEGEDYGEVEIHERNLGGKLTLREIGVYVFIFFTASMLGKGIQMTSYIPQYATNLGYSLNVGAALTSAIMVGNVSAKLIFGLISDWVGPWRTIQIFLCLIASSFIMLTTMGHVLPVVYLACLLLGFSYASGVGLSLVAVELFDEERFETQYSRNSFFEGLVTIPLPQIIAAVYDSTGSFSILFIALAALQLAGVVLISLRSRMGVVK